MEENQYILLLTKRWAGDIQPDEDARLQAWLEASPDHTRTAALYRRVWENSTEPELPFEVDLDGDFARLQQRLSLPAQSPARIRFMPPVWLRVAAAFALLLTAVWTYRTTFTGPQMLVVQAGDEAVHQTELPDGTRVWLRKNATLTYPATFASDRRVVALSGEAYFDVTHDPRHPFRVTLPDNGRVDVLGTQFAVNTQTGKSSVLVRSGKVRFQPADSPYDVVLTAYQAATYTGVHAPMDVHNLTSLNQLSWQSGGLEFVRTPLAQVVKDLESHYGVAIVLENPQLAQCLHTAPLTSQPIDKVLASLALTYGLTVRRPSAESYVLSGGSCN